MDKPVYEAIQVSSDGWRIEENGVRCFLFIGTDKALLVDSGYGTGSIRAEVEKLTDLPVTLVNTHSDGDHINCNKEFSEAYMHPAEFDRYHNNAGKEMKAVPVWEGDEFDLGTRKFKVILIPGHTPGSIALLDEGNRVLIAGDSIQAGAAYMFGRGRDMQAYIYSMEKLFNMRNLFDLVYPSHGSFPQDTDIIKELIDGAKLVLAGKVAGTKPSFETEALLYGNEEMGRAKFLY